VTIQEAIRSLGPKTGAAIWDIAQTIHRVEEHTDISFDQMRARNRKVDLVRARQLAMWALRHKTMLSYPQIGRIFDRDHTTVIHAVARIDGIRRANPSIRRWLDDLTARFEEVKP
jgi:chromosomal replication initiator protein